MKSLWRYYLFTFLVSLHFFSAVLIPFFTDWGGLNLTQVLFLQSWFMFWIFILEVPTGAVADYLGRKYSLALGAFIVTIGSLIYGSFPRFEIFLLGEFLFAACMAFISGADEALLYDTLKEEGRENLSKQIFGRVHSVRLLGMIVSALVGSLIASKLGLNYPMLFVSIPAVIAALVALSIKEPQVRKRVSESKRYLEIIKEGSLFFLKHKFLRILALDAVLVSVAAYYVIWLYQPLLKNVGVSIAYFGLIHAILIGSEIVVANNFLTFEKLVGSESKFIKLSAILTAVAFLLASVFPNIFTALAFIILGGGFGLTRLSLMSSLMNKFIPSERRATIISSISMFRRFLLVLLNPLVGYLSERSLGTTFLLIGLIPLFVFLFSGVKENTLKGLEEEI